MMYNFWALARNNVQLAINNYQFIPNPDFLGNRYLKLEGKRSKVQGKRGERDGALGYGH